MSSEPTLGSPRALQEWGNRVSAEYRSAAITAQVLQWGIRFGLPRPLLDTAGRIVSDELDHAELSHACLVALGGANQPMELDQQRLAADAHRDDALNALLETILRSFCFGETLAVPLFGAMRAGTTHPVARDALDRILRDEAVHRAFGWDALDALLAIDGTGVRAQVAAHLPVVVRSFRTAYGDLADAVPLTAAERSVGLLDAREYRDIFASTLDGDIRPRLKRRGMSLPA